MDIFLFNPPKPVADIKEHPEGDDINEGTEEERGAIPGC